MARQDRLNLIRELEALRGARILVAVWGDRINHATIIASDAHAVFFQHLEQIGKVPKIEVLLYATGGQTLAAWGLANLVREYCDELAVLIPHRALSAGTLFTLAANEIVMTRLGQLSPIDPSINSPLGPSVQVPQQPGASQLVPISVEDVVGFIDLAKKEADLKEERSILNVFDRLSTQVHPLALGAVYRTREQIKTLADRLLSFHMKGNKQKEERARIVTRLTRELGSHDYLIGRTEAKNLLKLNVIDVSIEVEAKLKKLFGEYSSLLELGTPYNPQGFLGADQRKVGTFPRAVVETTDLTTVFETKKEVTRLQIQQPGLPAPMPFIQENVSFEGWRLDETL